MIQYCHNRKFHVSPVDFRGDSLWTLDPRGGETIAFEVPASWFVEEVKVGDFFTRSVGRARCSNEENYNKKTGRDLATSRMKKTILTVLSNEQFTTERLVVVQDEKGDLYILKKPNGLDKVYFIGIE